MRVRIGFGLVIASVVGCGPQLAEMHEDGFPDFGSEDVQSSFAPCELRDTSAVHVSVEGSHGATAIPWRTRLSLRAAVDEAGVGPVALDTTLSRPCSDGSTITFSAEELGQGIDPFASIPVYRGDTITLAPRTDTLP